MWNAVNFGSGWFPVLRKRPGLSGARSLAEAWPTTSPRDGPPTAAWLDPGRRPRRAPRCSASPTPAPSTTCSTCSPRPGATSGRCCRPVRRLGGRAGSLGRGSAAAPVGHARRHAADARRRPVRRRRGPAVQAGPDHRLAPGPGFDGRRRLGRFADVDRLTAFADDLVPTRCGWRACWCTTTGWPAASGGRAAGGRQRRGGRDPGVRGARGRAAGGSATGLSAAALDHQLWQRGQAPEVKAVPRHRTRCPYY